jgi:Ca2+-binding EF-hand superfamily protein
MSNCKDQTEKVYSYSFQMFDENGDIYYDTGELLHNSSYDTEYGYSIDRVSINEFVAQNVTYSIQYNVTTLNGLELSTG